MSDLGRGYGCGVATVIAAVPVLPLAFVVGWSGAHCEPAPSCQRSSELHIGLIFVAILLIAAVIGYALRKLLNIMAAKREDGGYSTKFSGAAIGLSLTIIVTTLASFYVIASL